MRNDVLTLAQDLAAGNGSRDQTWCAVLQDLGLAAATQGSLQIYYTAATLTKKVKNTFMDGKNWTEVVEGCTLQCCPVRDQ